MVAGVLALATIASAQRIMVAPGRFMRTPPSGRRPADFDGSFIYCRGFYTSVRREAGGTGWWTDYPAADNNFSVRLMELTYTHVQLDHDRQPNTVVVRLADPLLYKCPILFMEDTGTLRFSSREVDTLRDYFAKGGFLYVDDFWGTIAWQQWAAEIGRVLPPGEFPIFDIPPGHPILHSLYDVKAVPQVSAINFWQTKRRQHVRARIRQPARQLPRHRRRSRPPHGRHDAQHRHRRHLGARGRGQGIFPDVLARRVRARREHRVVHDDALRRCPVDCLCHF